jgi:hypothetical protein
VGTVVGCETGGAGTTGAVDVFDLIYMIPKAIKTTTTITAIATGKLISCFIAILDPP